jgi:hypothetical protein
VSQTQFETEFNAAKDVFAALGTLRLSFNGLRPSFSWGPAEKEEKLKVLAERLYEFKELYSDLVSTAESLYPFLSEEIYVQINECMKRAHIEIMHIEIAGDKTFSFEWFQDGTKQREIFDEHYYTAAKLMRQYFKGLAIVSHPR